MTVKYVATCSKALLTEGFVTRSEAEKQATYWNEQYPASPRDAESPAQVYTLDEWEDLTDMQWGIDRRI